MCRDYIPDPDLVGNEIVQAFGNERLICKKKVGGPSPPGGARHEFSIRESVLL